jgi:hypothetical protein
MTKMNKLIEKMTKTDIDNFSFMTFNAFKDHRDNGYKTADLNVDQNVYNLMNIVSSTVLINFTESYIVSKQKYLKRISYELSNNINNCYKGWNYKLGMILATTYIKKLKKERIISDDMLIALIKKSIKYFFRKSLLIKGY